MSAAENFIGHTVSYIDGSITNTGDKTVTHVVVEVVFQDSMGQVAQRDEMPLQVIRTNGAYSSQSMSASRRWHRGRPSPTA